MERRPKVYDPVVLRDQAGRQCGSRVENFIAVSDGSRLTAEQHLAALRDILAAVDPTTGYIKDDEHDAEELEQVINRV